MQSLEMLAAQFLKNPPICKSCGCTVMARKMDGISAKIAKAYAMQDHLKQIHQLRWNRR